VVNINLPAIVNNLYINRKSEWMKEVEDKDFHPIVLQLWLVQNDAIRVQTRFLDQYVFTLPPKMFLSLAWSVIPKYQKMPFVRCTKKGSKDEKYDFLFKKIRKYLEMSDNDFNTNKIRLIEEIEKNQVEWFCAFGVEKKTWKKFGLDFSCIKTYGKKRAIPQKGLGAWGL